MVNKTELQHLSKAYFNHQILQHDYREKRRAYIHSLVGGNSGQFAKLLTEPEQLNTPATFAKTPEIKTEKAPDMVAKKAPLLPIAVVTVFVLAGGVVFMMGTDQASDDVSGSQPAESVQTLPEVPAAASKDAPNDIISLFAEITADNDLSEQDIGQITENWRNSSADDKQTFMSNLEDLSFENEELDSGLTGDLLGQLMRDLKVLDNPLINRVNQFLEKRELTDADAVALNSLWQGEGVETQEHFVQYSKGKMIEWHQDFEFEEHAMILESIWEILDISNEGLFASNEIAFDPIETVQPASDEDPKFVSTSTSQSGAEISLAPSEGEETNTLASIPGKNTDAEYESDTSVGAMQETVSENADSELTAGETTQAESSATGQAMVLQLEPGKPVSVFNEQNKKESTTSPIVREEEPTENIANNITQVAQEDPSDAASDTIPQTTVNDEEIFSSLIEAFSHDDWSEEAKLLKTTRIVKDWRISYHKSLKKGGMSHARAIEIVNAYTADMLVKLDNFAEIRERILELSDGFSESIEPIDPEFKKAVNWFWKILQPIRG